MTSAFRGGIPKTVGILVARMTSSRLPGKSLMPVNGRPLVSYVLERLKLVPLINEYWLATTDEPESAPLIEWAENAGLKVMAFPGDPNDVVGRISAVLEKSGADRLLIALGDSPFVDTRFMHRLLLGLDEHPYWEAVEAADKGNSVHCGICCFTASGWQKLDAASNTPKYREHLSSALADNTKILNYAQIKDDPFYYGRDYRLSVDTEADLAFVNRVFEELQIDSGPVPFEAVLHYLDNHPDVVAINSHVRQRTAQEASRHILMAVQAGGAYGTGHLMRCRTLATVLQENHAIAVTFWIDSPKEPDDSGQEAALRQSLQESNVRIIAKEISLTQAVSEKTYQVVLLDWQRPITENDIYNLRQHAPCSAVVALDNAGPGAGRTDLSIIPNAHSGETVIQTSDTTILLKGSDYTLLGSAFLQSRKKRALVTNGPYKLLVSMGGSDPGQLSQRIAEALKTIPDLEIDFVVPRFYENPEQLMETLKSKFESYIHIHQNVDELSTLMQTADLALVSFGITVYELAWMQVPTLILAHDESQLEDINRFCRFKTAISLGSGLKVSPDRLRHQIMLLSDDVMLRDRMRKAASSFLDNKGAHRVAAKISELASKKASLSEITV